MHVHELRILQDNLLVVENELSVKAVYVHDHRYGDENHHVHEGPIVKARRGRWTWFRFIFWGVGV
jgi:hypothetical protein